MNIKTGLSVMKTGLLVFCLLFGVKGIELTGSGVNNIINARQSASWPTTEGRILSSDVKKGIYRGTRIWGTGISYGAAISYEYSLNGESFSSNKVLFGEVSGVSGDAARAYVKKYPKGTRVSVFYDPDNPSVAVLESEVSRSTYLRLGIGVFLIVMLFGVYMFAVKVIDRFILNWTLMSDIDR